jgi:hypothetical protein
VVNIAGGGGVAPLFSDDVLGEALDAMDSGVPANQTR